MSKLTEVLKLLCYDPETDGNLTFNVTEALTKNWEKIDQLVLLAVAAAAAYDPEGSYAVGDYCTHSGKLHKCSTAIPDGETWTEAHWTTTTVAAELAELSSQLSNKVDNQAKEIPSSNCDNINDLSLYRVHSGTENAFHAGEGGILLSMPWDINRQQQIGVNPLGTTLAHRCKNGGNWGRWISIANAIPPQVRNLTLQSGFTANGGCTFFVTQESAAFLAGGVEGTMPANQDTQIGTLPADARPSDMCRRSMTTNEGPGYIELRADGTVWAHPFATAAQGWFAAPFVAGGGI